MAVSLSYQAILVEEFEYRKSRNSGYSLRAFARDLAMAPSSLNEVLNGTKGVSPAKAARLVTALRLSGDLGELFVLSVRAQHARAAVDRQTAAAQLAAMTSGAGTRRPRTTTIVSWVVEAVLKLSERRQTDLDPAAMARRLGVSTFSVRFALRYLARLGFLKDAPPSRAFLAYLGKGRRINVDYEQLLKRAKLATREPAPRDAFFHEPLLLDAQAVKKSLRLIERCFEDIKRLETTTRKTTLYYLTTQFFAAETAPDDQGKSRDQTD